jgi:hypothetical protein
MKPQPHKVCFPAPYGVFSSIVELVKSALNQPSKVFRVTFSNQDSLQNFAVALANESSAARNDAKRVLKLFAQQDVTIQQVAFGFEYVFQHVRPRVSRSAAWRQLSGRAFTVLSPIANDAHEFAGYGCKLGRIDPLASLWHIVTLSLDEGFDRPTAATCHGRYGCRFPGREKRVQVAAVDSPTRTNTSTARNIGRD